MSKKLTKQEFSDRANNIHRNKYDYSLVDYKNNKTKVKIICKEHGEFQQFPNNHLKGYGCEKCYHNKLMSNTDDFIEESKEIHGDLYVYSATTYSGCYEKVVITCRKHGDFEQRADSHKQGRGCPICNNSKGERDIRIFLEEHNINYETQKKFENCKNIFALPFDFYLTDYNVCIEYDGEQHFRPMGFSGGKSGFERVRVNDKIKNNFCNENEIKLIRIKFTENVLDILSDFYSTINTLK